MRGKATKSVPSPYGLRITPAYAGKSRQIFNTVYICQDHPRLCGEKVMTAVLVVSVGRITPAYAGKRRCGRRNGLCVQDHPRLCGEKKDRPPFSGCRLGSPPPMRGKVPKNVYRARSTRITPAYAGKRSTSKPKRSPQQDHPRLCGEKWHQKRPCS